MTEDTELLQRYLDRELSAIEAQRFRARLAQSAELRRELRDMQQVGALLRSWSGGVEARGAGLLEPTLRRVRKAQRLRTAYGIVVGGLALVSLFLLRGSSSALPGVQHVEHLQASHFMAGAAIERVEAPHLQAQVFVVGLTSTPVVWLEDDAQEEDGPPEQDPG